MGLNDLIYWYQKKIGTYDKQQWEKTVEQRIFGGFNNVPMRTAKLKTEFIDVDLVRGSSFPKAKPKHGLITVTWLAVKRLVLLPFYRNWWTQQTSGRIFCLFLLLYSLQILNVVIYTKAGDPSESNIVSMTELLVPAAMMFVLCTVHSQIVSTNSGPAIVKGHNRSRIRRSRHGRSRSGKLRPRRPSKGKNSVETAGENVGKSYSGIPSVRFAKKVCIDTSVASRRPSGGHQSEPTVSTPRSFSDDKIVEKIIPSSSRVPQPVINQPQEPPNPNVNENAENVDTIHQDDDGFESLNGNVSSDNDRATVRPQMTAEVEINKKSEIGGSESSDERVTNAGEIHRKSDMNLDKSKDNSDQSTKNDVGKLTKEYQCESEEEGECEEAGTNQLTEATTSATEWMGVTTNSDECSYRWEKFHDENHLLRKGLTSQNFSSDLDESEPHSDNNFGYGEFIEHPFSWELELPPSILLSSCCATSDRVSCTLWTRRDIKKAELSVLDISSAIIARAESMPESMDYFYGGLVLSIVLAIIPSIRRLSDHFSSDSTNNSTETYVNDLEPVDFSTYTGFICRIIDVAFGSILWERAVVLILSFERLVLSCLLFFLLAVAERTFKQRLLYAKLFSHLTSSRRARKSDLPHFRLNKVRNIKTWLSVRSYLKRRGPQRSVDVIVSAAFIVTLLLLSFVSLELIKDLGSLHSRSNIEALIWSFVLGIYLLRFMTLGTKINKKYRNLSVLITEQINLYLQIEQKPHKKEELTVANSVLKLAADLIKELESPFKISGLSANPYLYTITKVVLLSALSGVLSELLGFKLKLHKISIK
ncbi:putative homeodomain transcription factor isoform X2 [Diachasma alloeum]|uniref:putative homeodomain transcription factor isoform X2 n=1 Tax=Diachasma alloeum TaxID=454923 RepID=UPI0007381AEF|nr:putative homeodomain transcription factor isoform X2 [Diachasma alloeum]